MRSFTIANTWNGTLLAPEEQVKLQIRNQANTSLILTVNAPFYNDSARTEAGPIPDLYNYEVVHLFLLNSKGEYLEIELGPYVKILFSIIKRQNLLIFSKLKTHL